MARACRRCLSCSAHFGKTPGGAPEPHHLVGWPAAPESRLLDLEPLRRGCRVFLFVVFVLELGSRQGSKFGLGYFVRQEVKINVVGRVVPGIELKGQAKFFST